MNRTLFGDWLPPTFDPCAGHHHGDESSAAAHARIVSRKQGMQASILELARSRGGAGITSKSVAQHFATGTANISGRLTELKLLGLLRYALDAQGRRIRRDGAAVLVAVEEVQQRHG